MEELNEDAFLEDLVGFKTEEMSNGFHEFSLEQDFNNYYFLNQFCSPFGDKFSPNDFHLTDTPPFPASFPNVEGEPIHQSPVAKIRGKKLGGQPSKNLMAERRRRKRLNDRLSMLRSIVPKISKMDRTSIVGDTIEYVKELLDKINNLQQQQINVPSISTEFMFDVERRKEDTQIEMRCSAKPGLLLSTLSTLEALGLEIQHCLITCFNDFALKASCSEELDHRKLQSCEDVKQALFTSAGYGYGYGGR